MWVKFLLILWWWCWWCWYGMGGNLNHFDAYGWVFNFCLLDLNLPKSHLEYLPQATLRVQENSVPASLPVTWSLSCPLFLHHYIGLVTWALKHQRHFVAPNFAQNCPLPIFQPQARQEFNFSPVFSFNPRLIPGNTFFLIPEKARNNERSMPY